MLKRIYLIFLCGLLLASNNLCIASDDEEQVSGGRLSVPSRSVIQVVKVHDPKYDITFKILFGEEIGKDRTINFLNAVYSFDGDKAIKDVDFLPTSVTRFRDDDRTIHFDVKLRVNCTPYKGESFIVEMQKARIPALVNRFIFYGATELVESGKSAFEDTRKDRSKYYASLKPVHVLTILNFDDDRTRSELGNARDLLVWWDITERKSRNKMTNILDWAFLVLPRMKHDAKPHNTLERWIYLLNRDEEEEVEVTTALVEGSNSPLEHAYQRMARLTRDELSALRSSQESARVAHDALIGKFEEGRAEQKREMIIDMLEMGVTPQKICEKYNITPNELKEMQQESISPGMNEDEE